MAFAPDVTELLARARADVRMGVPILLSGAGGGLVLAAETIDDARLQSFATMGGGGALAITDWRAQTLKARAYDGDLARLKMPSDAPLGWVHAIADPSDDLNTPMKGPLSALRDGDAQPARLALSIAKEAQLLPSVVMAEVKDGMEFARQNTLTRIPAGPQVEAALGNAHTLDPIASARLPMSVSETGRLHVFRPEDGGEEHYAIEIGTPSRREPVLARLHSACFTGDLLGSLKCDCGPQLRGALAQMGQEGAGVLLYLNQEGRGIGLANKMRAYSLQDQGFDTVEANHRLGFEDDERDFRIGAQILNRLGFESIRLMTNNPAKLDMMKAQGIAVTERVPLKVGKTAFNEDYLRTKSEKSGHLL